ncbi:MAG: TlpA family protein disulfide reductase [Flavobacteriaceae bacterium]
MGKKDYLFLILSSIFSFLSHFLIVIIGVTNNLVFRYLFYGLVCFFIPLFFLLRYKQFHKIVFYFFLPPLLFNIIVSIHATISGSHILPLGIIGLFSLIFAYLISKKKSKSIIIVSSFFIIFMSLSSYGYANWLYGWEVKIINNKISNKTLIYNESGEIVDLSLKSNKVIVLDLWSRTCGSCFKKFPEFEEQYLKYKNDTLVEFHSLNLPLKDDNTNKIKKLLINYSFSKLYANDLKSWKELNVKSVPLIIVLDKRGEIRFKGALNTRKYMFYNNLNNIIEKLKNEEI